MIIKWPRHSFTLSVTSLISDEATGNHMTSLKMIRSIQDNCKFGKKFVFWARNFLTTWRNHKQEFFYLGPSHIPTGEYQNGKCPLRGHILAFALCTSLSSVADGDHKSEILMCYLFIWGDDLFEILCNFSCFQLLLKLLQICNALSTKT